MRRSIAGDPAARGNNKRAAWKCGCRYAHEQSHRHATAPVARIGLRRREAGSVLLGHPYAPWIVRLLLLIGHGAHPGFCHARSRGRRPAGHRSWIPHLRWAVLQLRGTKFHPIPVNAAGARPGCALLGCGFRTTTCTVARARLQSWGISSCHSGQETGLSPRHRRGIRPERRDSSRPVATPALRAVCFKTISAGSVLNAAAPRPAYECSVHMPFSVGLVMRLSRMPGLQLGAVRPRRTQLNSLAPGPGTRAGASTPAASTQVEPCLLGTWLLPRTIARNVRGLHGDGQGSWRRSSA